MRSKEGRWPTSHLLSTEVENIMGAVQKYMRKEIHLG
jgi:hypothetical protein